MYVSKQISFHGTIKCYFMWIMNIIVTFHVVILISTSSMVSWSPSLPSSLCIFLSFLFFLFQNKSYIICGCWAINPVAKGSISGCDRVMGQFPVLLSQHSSTHQCLPHLVLVHSTLKIPHPSFENRRPIMIDLRHGKHRHLIAVAEIIKMMIVAL